MNYDHSQIILLVLTISLLYNLIKFQNYVFVVVIGLYILLSFYQKPNILKSPKYEKKRVVEKIIETFDTDSSNITSGLYSVYKLPKKFKYLFVKPDILPNLIELLFVKRFTKELYVKIYVTLETFLKLFYNSIADRYDARMSLGTMQELYEEFKKYREELKINVPIMSKNIKRFGDRTLHDVVDTNMNEISKYMLKKIRLLKRSLDDDKIKYT